MFLFFISGISRALHVVRIVRERFEKHMRNFQPCAHLATGRKRTAGFRAGAMPSVLASKKKAHCWSHFIRLAKKRGETCSLQRDNKRYFSSGRVRGEKSGHFWRCTTQAFHREVTASFPELKDVRGFEQLQHGEVAFGGYLWTLMVYTDTLHPW